MKNTIIYLLGWPGVGKWTVAQALAKKNGLIVLDNQLTAAPLFTVMAHDTSKGNPDWIEVLYRKYHKIAEQVFEMAVYADSDLSYVFTDVLFDNEDGRQHFAWVEKLAQIRGAVFLPVQLVCDRDIHMQRVASPDRVERFKLANPSVAERLMDRNEIIQVDHPNFMTLDITNQNPSRTADLIAKAVERLSPEVPQATPLMA